MACNPNDSQIDNRNAAPDRAKSCELKNSLFIEHPDGGLSFPYGEGIHPIFGIAKRYASAETNE